MITRKFRCCANALAFGLALFAAPLSAEIIQYGDVSPDVGTWTKNTAVSIGHKSDGGVTVDGGSLLASWGGNLGHLSGVTGTATVTGAGSTWTNGSGLHVGSFGNGTLTIEAGGQVSNSYDGSIGNNSSSSGAVIVTGTGSTWNNSGRLTVGSGGNGTLTIEAGGQVSNSIGGSIGNDSGSSGAVIVTGTGSTWNNSGGLTVGSAGNGTLTIQDGGQVSNSFAGYLGYSPRSTGTVIVSGPGSKWSNTDDFGGNLYVGQGGNGTLTIEAGGQVSNTMGYLGHLSGSSGTATVTGAGSKWTNRGKLEVGKTGSLTVSDGGEVVAGALFASLDSLQGDGTITVTHGGSLDADLVFDAVHGNVASLTFGSGGALTVQTAGGDLGVGYWQSGSLTISEGVRISSNYGQLGKHRGSTGTATVTGEGSEWTNSKYLYVGFQGHGTLNIEAGGQVNNTIGYLGNHSGSSGTATVTGEGSKWINSQRLYVGHQGHGTLFIESGGQVSNTNASVGHSIGWTGSANVTGADSQWINSGSLYMGDYGKGELTIDAGGLVRNTNGYLGYTTHSTGAATVTGMGSQWVNTGDLYVGRDGSSSLTVEDGGLVRVGGTLTIDFNADHDSFINMATGGMLALYGDADDSLTQFLELVRGTDAIRYWDGSLSDWAPLTAATYGTDYTLEYLATGDLAGYTLLTVGTAIPEPSAWLLAMGLATLGTLVRRK